MKPFLTAGAAGSAWQSAEPRAWNRTSIGFPSSCSALLPGGKQTAMGSTKLHADRGQRAGSSPSSPSTPCISLSHNAA